MGRRSESSLAGNPILIGALTVLVVIVAVTLSYNATTGLPFVPTYSLHVPIADASELTHGDDVYMGGSLVGLVDSVSATRTRTGEPIAVMNLKLHESIKPLSVDSIFTIRLKGSIGLKYLEITRGHAKRFYADNATLPLGAARSNVDFDQVLSMFNPPTRTGVQRSTIGFGTALAARGPDINNALGAFVPLLTDLEPVAQNLSSPRTQLGGFFRGLNAYSGALSGVAGTNATLFTNLDTTFTALARVAVPSLQETISRTPPFFNATIAGSPTIRPFLRDTAALFAELRPGVATLPRSSPVLASTFAIGTRNLPGTAALDVRTTALSRRLYSYGQTPAVQGGLDRLTLTARSLRAPLAFLTPVQSTCNYVTLFLRNIQSTLSDTVAQGGLLRFVQIAIQDSPGLESVPSHKVYTGVPSSNSAPLHVNAYPSTASPGQTRECSAGNEPFGSTRAAIGNPAGNLGIKTETTKRGKG